MTPEQTTVVLLAAGHGKRMLPLTECTPKPLLKVGDHALIEHHLLRLAKQRFANIVINIAHLGDQLRQTLGNGERFGLNISYSDETDTGPRETAGGLKYALPLIQSDPFLVVNADIWTDFDFRSLLFPLTGNGRLVMVNNPSHNPGGDYLLEKDGLLSDQSDREESTQTNPKRTFSGVALYHKKMFEVLDPKVRALAPVFKTLIEQRQLEGLAFDGEWTDVGTPQRLEKLNQRYKLTK